MSIPTEPVGSIPRPFDSEVDALVDTIARFEATGSPVITDGEQTKSSFLTYPLDGSDQVTAGEEVVIGFVDGHNRIVPRLVTGPFKYATYAGSFIEEAKKFTDVPIKQAVISASALSLIYPSEGIVGYPKEEFLEDLVNEAHRDIRSAFDAGADSVQIDFTEGRLAWKLDPSGGLLASWVALINESLVGFSPEELNRIGVHVCPGGDQGSTHSADVDYAELLPALFKINAGRFYLQLVSESNPDRILALIAESSLPTQRIFVGVIDPISDEVETAETVRDRILIAASHIGLERLGTTDDCGFSPFGDDESMSRDVAFAKITARIEGTRLADEILN